MTRDPRSVSLVLTYHVLRPLPPPFIACPLLDDPQPPQSALLSRHIRLLEGDLLGHHRRLYVILSSPPPPTARLLPPDLLLYMPDLRPLPLTTSTAACLNGCFPRYFQGMAYGLSYPLLAHLVHSNIEHGHARGTEDARTGSWMGAVDERTRREKEGKGEIVQWAEVGQLLGGDEWWFAKSPDCELANWDLEGH